VGEAIGHFAMIEAGDRDGLPSGGKDSYGLLDIPLSPKGRAVSVRGDRRQPDQKRSRGFPPMCCPVFCFQGGFNVAFHIVGGYVQRRQASFPRGTMCSKKPAAAPRGAPIASPMSRRDEMRWVVTASYPPTFFLNLFFGAKLKSMPPSS
jgi:tRNA 2-thiocytidine biosynthesis protein TtcA